MAGFGDLLQRVARSLEEANAQRPGGDLRARLGYGAGDEDEDEDERASDSTWEPEAERGPGSTPTSRTAWTPKTVWSPEASRTPAHAAGTMRASGTHRAPLSDARPGGKRSSSNRPSHLHGSSASLLSERIRARLRTPDTLREAFVVKEILDRPLGRRHRSRGTR